MRPGDTDFARWIHLQAKRERSSYLLDLDEIREIHRRAVHPAEGPGEFRRSEIEGLKHQGNAPAREVPVLMERWLAEVNRPATWLHSGETMDRLAELHAEFERIHPFRNGNGRTGRLVVELLLLRLGYSRLVEHAALV
jgi:Fic family protein